VRLWAAALLLSLLCWRIDCQAATATSEPIKIGFIASLTGPAAENCQTLLKGFRLYLEQVNNQLGGRKVELVVADDGATPDTAKQAFTRLVDQDKVQLVCGLYFAHIAYAVAPLADKNHMPLVIAVAAADDLTQRKRSDWIVRTSWSSSQSSHAFGSWVYKHLGYKRIACVAMDYPFGYEQVGGFQTTFEKAGGKVVQKLWVPIDVQDFSTIIKSIRKDADAIYISLIGHAAQIAPPAFQQYGRNLPIVGNGDSFDEAVISAYGDFLQGDYSCLSYSDAIETGLNKDFVSRFHDKYGRNPTAYAERGYTAALVIDKALAAVKGNIEDKAMLMSALRNLPINKSPRGPIKIDDFGNPIQNIYIRRVKKVEGGYQNVVVDTIPHVSQFWTFDPQAYLKQPVYTRDYPPCKFCSELAK
jgi:branched-chain amino acid transport system substrate-binding protein